MPDTMNVQPPNLLAEYQTRSASIVLTVRMPYQRFIGTTPNTSGSETIKNITVGMKKGELIIMNRSTPP
jgi:hypothetical protein